MVRLALELMGPWVVLGFSVDMEVFDELLLINVPWSQEFSGVLRIWCLENPMDRGTGGLQSMGSQRVDMTERRN